MVHTDTDDADDGDYDDDYDDKYSDDEYDYDDDEDDNDDDDGDDEHDDDYFAAATQIWATTLCCPDLMLLRCGYIEEYWKYHGQKTIPTRKYWEGWGQTEK